MTDRRWQNGDFGELHGLRWRVRTGAKHPEDLVLEINVEGYWLAVSMTLGFLLADFFFQNEDVLYPPSQGYRGGYKYLNDCKVAALHGWDKAAAGLRAEKAMKADRLFDTGEVA